MRILQLANLYAPVIGGLERSVATSSEELVRRGHEVTVLTLAHPGAPREEMRNGVRVVRARSIATTLLPRMNQDPAKPFHPTAPDPLTTVDIRSELRAGRYDVVHSHDWLMYSYLPLRHGRDGVPHVHTAHDFGLMCVKKTFTQDGRHCPTGPRLGRCLPCATGQYGRPRSLALLPHRLRQVVAGAALEVGVQSRRGQRAVEGALRLRVAVAIEQRHGARQPLGGQVRPHQLGLRRRQ